MSFFFSREPQPQNRSCQCAAAYPELVLAAQLFFKFLESGIRGFGDCLGKHFKPLLVKSRKATAAMRLWRRTSRLLHPVQEIAHTAYTHPKTPGDLLACALFCIPSLPDPLP